MLPRIRSLIWGLRLCSWIPNICTGIGRGQMTVADTHIAHHKHTCDLYRELLKDVKGQEDTYQATVQGAVGGAGGVTHVAVNTHTDCEPNANVEAMRVGLD